MNLPQLVHFADIEVEVDVPMDVGLTPHGRRRMIRILGGRAVGDGWTATVLPGGADYQRIVGETRAELEAHYLMETDSGQRLYVHNSAIRHASPEATAQLMRGEPVDPAQVYFRCLPRLEAGPGPLEWVNHRLFVGSGTRLPDRVRLQFFLLD